MKNLMYIIKVVFLSVATLFFWNCEEDDMNLPKVTAGFTFTQNNDTGTVSFINISENADSYLWSFGNGTSSTEKNPITTFTSGIFTVTLTATNNAGASAKISDEITVTIPGEETPTTPDPDPETPFDSGLLKNGDFEDGSTSWIGEGVNIVTEGGNSFNSANVEMAGNPFDVNLSQIVSITQGVNYTLTFTASSDRSRSIIAGIGLNEAPWTNTTKTIDLTTDSQTFTLQLAASDFGIPNSRVLFDMGAAVGLVRIDNVSLVEGGDGSDSGVVIPPAAFDPGLLTNGDFENGVTSWSGNAANVVTEGGNSFNSANIEMAGDAFAVNLSQVVSISQGTSYTLKFDASSDRSRTMIAGIGLNEGPWTNASETVNLTTETQTFTLQLTATDFGIPNSRVLFDMGAAVGAVVIDNVSLVENTRSGGTGGCTGELVGATTLPLDFEGCATFDPSLNFGAQLTTELVDNPFKTGINTSDHVLKIDKPTGADFFAGIQNDFNNFDLTTTNTFKMKVYSTKANVVFRYELAVVPNDGSIGNPAPVFVTIPNANQWTEVSFTFINLPASTTTYNRLVLKPDNDQMDSAITNGGTYYIDDVVLE